MPSLFDPIRLGTVHGTNRILMAPLTRGRATREHVPTKIMAEYYSQRASAGLIIAEATGISREGLGWPYAPGIWNEAQVVAWQVVTAAVHDVGGHIYSQLWQFLRDRAFLRLPEIALPDWSLLRLDLLHSEKAAPPPGWLQWTLQPT